MKVRPLAPTDSIDALTALLHRAYAPLAAMGLNYTAADQSPATTAQRIEGGACFVAERDGRIVGTAVVHPPSAGPCAHFALPHVASLRQFGVDPDLQSQGIGAALLARCEAWAAAAGFREIALDTAEPARHLLALYQRWGFRQVGTVQWHGKTYRSAVLAKPLDMGSGLKSCVHPLQG